MSGSGLRYDRYFVNGREEWAMAFGVRGAPCVLFIPPLFEEMNRTRALLAAAMRALAVEGFRCLLPDLPGTGESETALESVEWRHWRDAVTAAAAMSGARAVVSVRGGALLDDVSLPRWQLSPVTGAALVRDLERTGILGASGGGYAPSAALLNSLRTAAPSATGPLRTTRLASDPAPADMRFEAAPLWRRSEPQAAPALAAAMAADIAAWVRQCAAS